jgi:pimeloyl-ACP methyl ester carboxylesterase
MTLLRVSAIYFAVVFAAGFVFGAIRVSWLVPRLGVRLAELTELPLMLTVVFFSARWVHRRFLAERTQPARLIVGIVAFALLLVAELILGVTLGGLTPAEVFLNHDPVSGTAYYLSLCVFAVLPWYFGRAARRGEPPAGGISEKIKVDIGGVAQGMFIKGRNVSNPVLLYLHGGMPDYFLTERYPTGLDEEFTVVWWEQRGSGLSYSADVRPESVNPEQLVSDTLELTNYLRRRFGREKIYLMGHSGGTFIGMQAAARAPELYSAYLAVAQMSNQLESERLAYDYMLQRFRQDGNTRMARRLENAPVGDTVPLPDSYLKVRDVAMHLLGVGTTHDMTSIVTGLLLPSLMNRDYTLGEKVSMWRGKIFSGNRLWNAQLSTDLTRTVTRLEVPVYFFHGAYDYTVSYPLARAYYERLDAPVKGFYTFKRSAHSPLFEEPEKLREIVRVDVLRGAKGLADPE